VERLNQEQGMAILYTTHYMEEAQRLCHSVGIMDRGEIIALDTPKDLIAMLGGGIIHIGLAQADDSLRSAVVDLPVIKTATFLPPDTPPGGVDEKQVLKVEAIQANEALLQIINLLNKRDVDILSIETLDPNLETVFLHLTGKSLRQ
jgi:ABC-2 type transport system ATP-binding protein